MKFTVAWDWLLALFAQHLRQLVGLRGDSRYSFTIGALIMMLWIFPEDHWIILGDISKPQACTMSPSDYTYPQRRKMSKFLKEFLKENGLKNSIFEKTRFLLFEAYGPQKWSYEWFVRLFGNVLDCFWSFETHRHPKCSKILKISIFLTKPSKILYFELIWASEAAGWLRVWL